MDFTRVFSNTTVQKHQFFGPQLSSQSNSHITGVCVCVCVCVGRERDRPRLPSVFVYMCVHMYMCAPVCVFVYVCVCVCGDGEKETCDPDCPPGIWETGGSHPSTGLEAGAGTRAGGW